MTEMMDANEFLMGGGIPSASFPTIGTKVEGEICEPPRVEQQKDLDTGELRFWPDGKPMMQLRVVVQTELRDPEIIDDDGRRAFYIKGNMLKSVRQAVRASGAKGLEIGGHLSIMYTADGEAKKKGFNPPKLYVATYTPPAAAAANAMLMGERAPATPAPGPIAQMPAQAVQQQMQQAAPVQQTVPAAPAPAAPAGLTPEQQAALANLTPEQRAALGFPA